MKNLLLLCGGQSSEHEVSILSAKNILTAVDKSQFNVILIGISKSGVWHLMDNNLDNVDYIPEDLPQDTICTLIRRYDGSYVVSDNKKILVDVAFPILHGPYGEDGIIQGMLEAMSIPYVGCGVLSSAIGMDKILFKELMVQNNILVAPFKVINKGDDYNFHNILKEFNTRRVFVKVPDMGSSIGIYKVSSSKEFDEALKKGFEFSERLLLEKDVMGRDIECAVLGNKNAQVSSCVAEIVPDKKYGFYSYEAKYIDKDGAKLIIPANLPKGMVQEIQDISLKVFKIIGGRGMVRVDFLVSIIDRIFLNEVNSIPGFTSISMYPKLWEYSGLSYTDLISKLIFLALNH